MAANKKVSPKDLPHSLTKDTDVIKAMKAIQRAGFWATLGGGFIILWYIFTIFMSNAGLNQLVIYAPWSAYLFWSGYRLNRLKGNKSILAILIINTVIGGLVSLQAIFSILALFKYGTYRDWYENDDSTDTGKGQQTVPPKRNSKRRSVALPIAIVISSALVLIGGIGGWVYINQQKIDQRNRELSQQKELKEKELQTLKDAAWEDADAKRDAARTQCRALSGGDWFSSGCW